jgi:hypothetical protein
VRASNAFNTMLAIAGASVAAVRFEPAAAMWGVTPISRSPATKSLVSKLLSPPTVRRRALFGSRRSRLSAVSRSAYHR